MRNKFLKRSDEPSQLASAILHYEKQPQTREVRRRLAKLRAKFAKLSPQKVAVQP